MKLSILSLLSLASAVSAIDINVDDPGKPFAALCTQLLTPRSID
jgi:hypothetical protein